MFPDACPLVVFTLSAPLVLPVVVNLVAAAVSRWLRPWHAVAETASSRSHAT